MTNLADVKALLHQSFPQATQITVTSDSDTLQHLEIAITSPEFAQIPLVKQHQAVYKPLQPWLNDNTIHAIKLKTSAS